MNKINIAELLKDCPKGMELDCTMYEDVYFDYVDELNMIHCYIQHETYRTSLTFNQHGTPNSNTKSKCVIFPKGKTTWEGFVPPCKFKDGDILATDLGSVFFLNTRLNTDECYGCYVGKGGDGSFHVCEPFAYKECCGLATGEEKQKLFDAIKANGYKWNAETKTLEKLPTFKVGDIVCDDKRVYRIYDIDDTHYKSTYIQGGKSLCNFFPIHTQDRYRDVNCHFWVGDRITDQKKFIYLIKEVTLTGYILKDLKNTQITFEEARLYFVKVPDKFDITTLKPFDKVLVRETNEDRWLIDFYAFYNEIQEFSCVKGMYEQCIPYEGNEHLFLSFDDCDEYFKTWE